tara:strand:+ start:4236 stop:7064 length:2829 start_codon:yes stop_codon:yes gene_type:complete
MAFGEIDIPFWQEAGFRLAICEVTGSRFRTRDPQRKTCGDTHLDSYTFIGTPIISGYEERGSALKEKMRETFLDFYEKKGHARLEPYPVIARWRDDIHLTIASIADFQPHVTSGRTPPPANPLTISQPCIRLTDVAAVGRSGRHLTTFEMMAHHAFNRDSTGEYHYWIDNCVRLCDELLVETFGIDPAEITYVENPWSGGGNAGAALEVIVGGLELATLVFMDLEEHQEGEIEIKGLRYRQMDQKIIDTGYGLERFCWAAAGTPTIYETVYPESVQFLRNLAKFDDMVDSLEIPLDVDTLLGELSRLAGILNIDVGTDADALYSSLADRISQNEAPISVSQLKSITEPLALIYAIPDHLQALCSMLGDGLVPSNSKAGYLARMLARRVCRMKDELGVDIKLADLGNQHLDLNMANKKDIDRNGIIDMLNSEERKYTAMLERGRSAVATALKDTPSSSSTIDDEILYRLAEERGIQPDMTLAIARDLGWKTLEIRVGFAADMAARNAQRTKEAALKSEPSSLTSTYPPTIRLFDENPGMAVFDAQVIDCVEIESVDEQGTSRASWILVLDSSAFYPESGGQLGDRGTLGPAEIYDVRIENGVILHYADRPIKPGRVSGSIDEERRLQISQHHSSVHVVGGSARQILGPHVWQAGSFKNESLARLDVTHYGRLSRTQLDQIEDHANEIVSQNRNIEITVMPRAEADSTHGFSIYQGGPPKHDMIRLVNIEGHDLQACGGTHVSKTSEIGEIRIVRSSQVQDGVERLVVMAGEAAREHARVQSELLSQSADILGVQPQDLPQAVDRFFNEWKDQRKTIEQLRGEIARIRAGGESSATTKDGIRYVIMEMDGEVKELMGTLGELTRDPNNPTVAVIASKEGGGKLVVAITEDSIASEKHDASKIIQAISPAISGSGGGRPTMAQAGGTDPSGIDNALKMARSELGI